MITVDWVDMAVLCVPALAGLGLGYIAGLWEGRSQSRDLKADYEAACHRWTYYIEKRGKEEAVREGFYFQVSCSDGRQVGWFGPYKSERMARIRAEEAVEQRNVADQAAREEGKIRA